MQARLFAERLGRTDLLAVDAGRAAPGHELVGVLGIVERRRDEEAADVLDAVGRDVPEDPVLADALLGGVRILDRVATARVEQTVEAAGRTLGQVEPVDEHHVVAPERRVPGHTGPRSAPTDNQDIGAQGGHGLSLLCRGRPLGPPSTSRAPSYQLPASNQSKVRVTAFFQYL